MRAGHQRRLYIMSTAGSVMRLAADSNHGAVPARHVEIGADLFEAALVYQRPYFGRGIERMPHLEGLHPRREFFNELFRDALLNQEPARRGAALAFERRAHEHAPIE